MRSIRYTLIADGPSDRTLIPIIDWTLSRIPDMEGIGVIAQFANLRKTPQGRTNTVDRIRCILRDFPCDVLFFHRDAEKEPRQKRIEEIAQILRGVSVEYRVPLVPVRMTEAWLLIDVSAIRTAAGNPNGSVKIILPHISKLESLIDPKEALREQLLKASEKKGRKLQQFRRDISSRIYRVADLIRDFTPLRRLKAFSAFENETRKTISRLLDMGK